MGVDEQRTRLTRVTIRSVADQAPAEVASSVVWTTPPGIGAPHAHAAAGACLARALTAAIDPCELTEAPLTQRQRVQMIEAALLEFYGYDAVLRPPASSTVPTDIAAVVPLR